MVWVVATGRTDRQIDRNGYRARAPEKPLLLEAIQPANSSGQTKRYEDLLVFVVQGFHRIEVALKGCALRPVMLQRWL